MVGFHAHHRTMAKSGQDATTASANVRSSAGKLGGSTPKAISEHQGWESSAALQKCLTAWEKRLKDLAYEVQTIGENLGASTKAYQKADQEIVSQLNKLASQIEGLKK